MACPAAAAAVGNLGELQRGTAMSGIGQRRSLLVVVKRQVDGPDGGRESAPAAAVEGTLIIEFHAPTVLSVLALAESCHPVSARSQNTRGPERRIPARAS